MGILRCDGWVRATSLLALAPFASQAQAPEITSRESAPAFSSRVNLVTVAVVVRDAKGNSVGTLRQEDFQLLDQGKPQLITRFSMERPGSPQIPTVTATEVSQAGKPSAEPARPPAAIPEHFVAYVFDDVHVKGGDLLRVRLAA